MASRSTGSSSKPRDFADNSAQSVPASLTVPASTASGRSVFSRITITGLPSEGPSSWIPPESVSSRIRAPHQIHKRNVVERLDQMNARHAGKITLHGPDDVGVAVNGVNDFHVAAFRDHAQGSANVLETLPEALPAVGCHHDQALIGGGKAPVAARELARDQPVPHMQHRVDTRVSRDMNGSSGNPFTQQIGARPLGGGQMQRRQPAGRPRGSSPRETAAACRRCAGRLRRARREPARRKPASAPQSVVVVSPCTKDDIRPDCGVDGLERRDDTRRRRRQRLPRHHEVQIEIGNHTESFENLVEHLPVLRRLPRLRTENSSGRPSYGE